MTVETTGKAQPSTEAVRGYLPLVDLAPGDRFPNFTLPDQTGAARSFLERAKGNPLLILGDGRDDTLQTFEATRKERPEADCLALVGEEPGAAAKRAEALGLDFPLLADSAG